MKIFLYRMMLFFCLTLLPIAICAQTNYYNVTTKNDTIGVLKVSKIIESEKVIYHYAIDIGFEIVTKIHILYDLSTVYKNDALFSASVDNTVNGRQRHKSDLLWKDSYYEINEEGKKSRKFGTLVNYSNIKLFFYEPIDVQKVFSEHAAEFGTLKLKGKNHYELTLHTGAKNHYYYKDGILVKANIGNSFIPFQLVLRKK
ncbi:DUF6134 family protein [Maribacter arcticus]|uniref:DUF3108 domain-containing protein n=1 Tax=Maribacter arcticus TaxID=561365 RepID=A0A1T5CHU3_9FLAO|nr:DUF6134 family protein [Maribacter arcticus]SKB58926.1 hypothetical protein SAMN05660866_02304 [Maribacter arcticus]